MHYLFVDTGAWLALELRNDQHHQDAKAFAQGQGRQYQWLTTNWILSETLTMLRRRTNHAVAVRFGQRIRASQQLSLLRVDEDREDRVIRDQLSRAALEQLPRRARQGQQQRSPTEKSCHAYKTFGR